MTEERLTVSGEVVNTTEWKSKKGSWVNLKDNPNDFYAYKGKVPEIGEKGTWQVTEGTGVMADKVELVKAIKEDLVETAIAAKTKADIELIDKSIESGEKTYFERQNLIVRQCCIKASAAVVGHLMTRETDYDLKQIADKVTDMADKFYDWVVYQDEPLPEPPEEP